MAIIQRIIIIIFHLNNYFCELYSILRNSFSLILYICCNYMVNYLVGSWFLSQNCDLLPLDLITF